MRFFTLLLLVVLLFLAGLLLAQQPQSYDLKLTEPDQELDDFKDKGDFEGIHRITPRMRGVRGIDNTLYWVSADRRRVTAYQRGRQVWQANVAKAFFSYLPDATVITLVFCFNTVFVLTNKKGHAEIDRATGVISAVGVDPN